MMDLFGNHCVTGRGWIIHIGDVLQSLRAMATGSLHMVVTSPPYFGHRCYLEGDDAEIGIESTPEEYVAALVAVFTELKRVLRPDGTVFLNIGNTYAAQRGGTPMPAETLAGGNNGIGDADSHRGRGAVHAHRDAAAIGLKHKDLIGIPWRVAFALQAAGWYLRDEIIWAKETPMPQSVEDRTTTSHEQIFLLTQRPVYFYDQHGFREFSSTKPVTAARREREDNSAVGTSGLHGQKHGQSGRGMNANNRVESRNLRSVWSLSTEPLGLKMCKACKTVYTKTRFNQLHQVAIEGDERSKKTRRCACGVIDWLSHFAAFPSEIPARCIKLGTSERGVCPACLAPWLRIIEKTPVLRERPNEYTTRTGEAGTGNSCANTVAGTSVRTIGWEPSCACNAGDPIPATVGDLFTGSGTTAMVATELGRQFVGFELNPDYAVLSSYRADSWRNRELEPPPVPLIGQESLFP